MATDGKATWWNASAGTPAYNAQELRQLDSLNVMPGPVSEPFSGRSGRRVNGSGLAVTVSSTGAGTVSTTPGVCLVYSSAQSSQGVWEVTFPAVGPIALSARPPAGQSRIDLVVARLYDSDSGIGTVKEAKIEVIAGTASGTPSAPSLPAMAFELDRLTVPNSGTITHVQSTQRTVAAGGILPVATTAEMDALKTAGIAYRDMVVGNEQADALYRYNGTSWRPISDGDTGWVDATYNAGWADSPGGFETQYRVRGGQTTIVFWAAKAAYNAGEVVVSIATSAAPSVSIPFSLQVGGVLKPCRISPAGLVTSDNAGTGGVFGSVTFPAG